MTGGGTTIILDQSEQRGTSGEQHQRQDTELGGEGDEVADSLTALRTITLYSISKNSQLMKKTVIRKLPVPNPVDPSLTLLVVLRGQLTW